jgi:Rps23 Pro-64 3,4-dihydroxylase Tpa1-like proline 4-hydroxylase
MNQPRPAAALSPRISDQLNRHAIRQAFQRHDRVHVPGIFTQETATRVYQALERETPWQLSLNSGAGHVDLANEVVQVMPAAQQVLLVDAINRGASAGFQYVFHNFPIFDLYQQGRYRDHYLMRVYEYLNSTEFLIFARDVTGLDGIEFVDAQATLYRPGHFLTAHDDSQAGKQRLAAYVLNFTAHWRADWGGILQFIDEDGHIAEGFTPAFNALNLLRVPQKHCVSYVTPAAIGGRYSITGWLRGS